MADDNILRFHTPDKVFHGLNAICWFILLFSGVYVYFFDPEDHAAAVSMMIHLGVGVIFTLNFLAFLVFAPDRFALILKACMEWDKNTFLWFRNFGGYPRRLFHIPFGPVEVAPQGRYNAGQKATYIVFFLMIFLLIVTGWALWVGPPIFGKAVHAYMLYFHVWGSILISCAVVFVHVPLAMLSWDYFKGIWRIGPGTIPMESAKHHAPVWVDRDVVRTNTEK